MPRAPEWEAAASRFSDACRRPSCAVAVTRSRPECERRTTGSNEPHAAVVRRSQEWGVVAEALLRVIGSVASRDEELWASNRFVTYGHDDAITAALSAWCAHRVIWGGDETVAAIRPLPLPSHASERVFGSKYSFAVIDATRYGSAPQDERARIASGFFNDLFWFDQM